MCNSALSCFKDKALYKYCILVQSATFLIGSECFRITGESQSIVFCVSSKIDSMKYMRASTCLRRVRETIWKRFTQ